MFSANLKKINNAIAYTASKIQREGESMQRSQVARKLSEELGIEVTYDRINKYEERGITPSPPMKKGKKDYGEVHYERLKKIVVMAELGVPLAVIRKYILGVDRLKQIEVFLKRIKVMSVLIVLANKLQWDSRKSGTAER